MHMLLFSIVLHSVDHFTWHNWLSSIQQTVKRTRNLQALFAKALF